MADPQLLMNVWRGVTKDAVAFRAQFPTPAIVWEAPLRTESDAPSWEPTHNGQRVTRPTPGEALIYRVEKSSGASNPFPMGVTLGRVDSNDLVLDDASVSRFHAWLQLDERTQQWSLTDAESRNGTWVNGVKCEARKRTPLNDGAEIRLGDASLRFFLPDTLITWVKAKAAQESNR